MFVGKYVYMINMIVVSVLHKHLSMMWPTINEPSQWRLYVKYIKGFIWKANLKISSTNFKIFYFNILGKNDDLSQLTENYMYKKWRACCFKK